MVRSDIILFLDLETTGNQDDAAILEVGIVATDQTPDLNILGHFVSLVEPEPFGAWYDLIREDVYHNRVVRDMHKKSGLLQDIEKGRKEYGLLSIKEVEGAILYWLQSEFGKSSEHIPLAGSGVSHFDRKFIRRDWPKFDRLLTYWTYDVGVLRRAFRLAGAPVLDGTEDKTHRALEDALFHVDEGRFYLNYLYSTSQVSRPVAA